MHKFYVIGTPIKRSKSPLLFSYIFKTLQIPASYSSKHIKNIAELNQFIGALTSSKETCGINVTMPYKQSVIKYLDKLNQSATITKAVNCIKRENNVYMGYNNDVVGFSKLLNKYNINISGSNNIIIGSGGSARAVILSLIQNNAKHIYILSRNQHSTTTLFEDFGPYLGKTKIEVLHNDSNLTNCNLINCTPLGTKKNINTSILNYIPKNHYKVIIDINYNSNLECFNQISGKKINGNAMFVFQALASLDIWFASNISNKLNYQELEKKI